MKASWVVAATALILASSGIANAQGLTPAERLTVYEAEAIADAFVASKYPDFDKAGTRTTVKFVGDQIVVGYLPLELGFGGAPVVVIDRKTMKVVDASHEQ